MRGRKSRIDHPFPQRLIESGSSIAEWARKNGPRVTTVSSWVRKAQTRPIPDYWADVIEEQYGIRAVPKSWPGGIKLAYIRRAMRARASRH